MDQASFKSFLRATFTAPGELDLHEIHAVKAADSLIQLKKLFSGRPEERLIDEMIDFCYAVHARAVQLELGVDD